jgi:hypothetical protein
LELVIIDVDLALNGDARQSVSLSLRLVSPMYYSLPIFTMNHIDEVS